MSEHNPHPKENNTGHFWDDEQDIRELNNRPPRWYMWTLYISIVSVIVYAIYFPTVPWFGSHNKGVGSWTAIKELRESQQQLDNYRNNKFNKEETLIARKTPSEILENKELTNYAARTAKILFADNCSACHGAEGSGNIGFPILADDDWLYGGTVAQIYQTLLNGKKGIMPAHEGVLSTEEIDALTDFVISKGEAEDGKELYTSKGCVACHGVDMKGIQALGSANLTDAIYRFKPDLEAGQTQRDMVRNIIAYGVNQTHPKSQEAIMPAFVDSRVIDNNELKKLAIYVHQLGGGQ